MDSIVVMVVMRCDDVYLRLALAIIFIDVEAEEGDLQFLQALQQHSRQWAGHRPGHHRSSQRLTQEIPRTALQWNHTDRVLLQVLERNGA